MKTRTKVRLGVVLGVILLAFALPTCSYYRTRTIETVIVGADIKRYENVDVFLVFTEDGATFRVGDSWRAFRWDSADVYGRAKGLTGRRVRIEAYGWRIPYLSWYPNLLEVEAL